MGRDATKAAGNAYYEARMTAAKYNGKLSSREGAAELLGMSVSSVADAELGLSKCMPVDKAVLMADLYNSPHLLNHYCINECPIGRYRPISAEIKSIEQVTVSLLKNLKVCQIEDVKESLVDIADDGVISAEEIPALREIVDYLDKLEKTVSELKIIAHTAFNKYKE